MALTVNLPSIAFLRAPMAWHSEDQVELLSLALAPVPRTSDDFAKSVLSRTDEVGPLGAEPKKKRFHQRPFRVDRGGRAFFFKQDGGIHDGAPAESRTVPGTMIAGRGCGEEVCASAGVQLVENIQRVRQTSANLSNRRQEFIARILLMGRPPCKDSVSRRSPLPCRCLTKIRATRPLGLSLRSVELLYRFSTISMVVAHRPIGLAFMENKYIDYLILVTGILILGVVPFLERAGLFLYLGYTVVRVLGTILALSFFRWGLHFFNLVNGRCSIQAS